MRVISAAVLRIKRATEYKKLICEGGVIVSKRNVLQEGFGFLNEETLVHRPRGG